ncbi:MAG: restriction endonuclease subunit S [Gaiellaceae bacterium]
MASWRETTLAEIAELFSGGTPAKSNPAFWGGDLPWVTAKDMVRPRLARSEVHITDVGAAAGSRRVPAGSTLVLVRGMTLHDRVPVCLATREVAFNQDVKAIVGRDGVDSTFLFYAVRGRAPILQNLVDSASHGTGRISTRALADMPVLLPSRHDQRRIATLLAALDDKIELNRRIAATAHKLANAIFRSRYSSDDPRLPHEVLGEHVKVARGLSYAGAGLADDGLPLHNLNSIREGGGYKRSGIKYYRSDYQQRHLVEPGDVVVATVEQGFDELLIAFPARIPGSFGEVGLFSQDLFRLRPRTSSPVSKVFLYLTLLRGHLHEEIAGYANGTTVNASRSRRSRSRASPFRRGGL